MNPLITKQRLFYETLEEVLPGVKVIITDGTTETMLPLESFVQEEQETVPEVPVTRTITPTEEGGEN